MARLWDKGYDVDRELHRFTVGDDYLLDLALVEPDCIASAAHARMLAKIGILKPDQADKLVAELAAIIDDVHAGKFTITPEQEDCHTAIENRLTEKLDDLGKRIHAARSRNDQVIAALRIYGKVRLFELIQNTLELATILLNFADEHRDVPMVGRTHMQRAMPSSVALWAGAYMESLLDDVELLLCAFKLNDQCPLGSAASYGVPLPIDRQLTSDLLGFARLTNNVIYANNSRGKIESVILSAAAQICTDLSRLAQDLMIYSTPEFGYFTIPKDLCTGSSIMPQKRNPCGLELLRAKTSTVNAALAEMLNILTGLPSGYNRDLQQTKGPFMRGLDTTISSVRVAKLTFVKLKVNKSALLAGFDPSVYATDAALELVAKGIPFRDAYRQVAQQLGELADRDASDAISARTHVGSTGNLNLKQADRRIVQAHKFLTDSYGTFHKAVQKLFGRDLASHSIAAEKSPA